MYMINDFLKKYQEELISDKIDLKEDMDLLDTKIKEETKFLSLLEDTNDSYFSDFSPRDLNVKNKEKAEEVKAVLSDLQEQQQILNEKMKFFDSRLLELNNLINNTAVKNTVVNTIPTPISTEVDVNTNINTDNDDIISSLEDIKKVILLDPYRASMMLESLINSLKD